MTIKIQTGIAKISAGAAAQQHMSGKIMDFDHGTMGIILGALEGIMLPITTTTTAPSAAPAGGAGLVIQVVGGVITLWIWDGTQWRSKS